jgi:hypothetical protein
MNLIMWHALAFLLSMSNNKASMSDLSAVLISEGAPPSTDFTVIVNQLQALGLATYDAATDEVTGLADGAGSVITPEPGVAPGITAILQAIEAAVGADSVDQLQEFRDAYQAAGYGATDLRNLVALGRGVALIGARKLNNPTARDEMMRAARAGEHMLGAA